MKKEDLRAKVCHVCGTTEDLVACPACHWWFCKEHDLHECTPEPQTPVDTYYAWPKPSRLWYLFPFFFGLLGGVIAYFAIRNDDQEMAEGMLIFGTFMTVLSVVFFWLILT